MPQVTGPITTTSPTDSYPTHDSLSGIGGYREVADHTALNAISTARRRQGMLVYVISDSTYWTLKASPWGGTDADWEATVATHAYVDGVAQGLDVKSLVQLATTAALPANSYAAGVLTASANGALTVDGTAATVGDRILVKDEVGQLKNGIYDVTTAGDSTHAYVLTRSSDMDAGAEVPRAYTFVAGGSANAGAGFTVASAGPFTIGTTAIPWTQFSNAGSITAGDGLTKTGSTLDVVAAAGITVGANSVGVDFSAVQGKSAILDGLAALASAGFVIYDGSGVNSRSIAAGSSKVTVANGTGAAGNPSIDVNEANLTLGNLGGTVPIAKGGTGQATQATGFDALSPTTSLGDIVYRGGSNNVRLPGNTAASAKVLAQTGTGSVSAAPAWADPTSLLPPLVRTTRYVIAPYGDTRPADYTCANATGNQAEINAAIAFASVASPGAIVDLLDGVFTTSSKIIPLNNVRLRGQGMFVTRINTSGTFNVVDFTVGASRDATLNNFALTDLEVDCSNFDTTIGFKAINGFNYKNCRFQRLYVHDSTATGIGIDFPTNSVISDNLVVNCGYQNKWTIAAASWAANVFTYTTAVPHGYSAPVVATNTLTASGTPSDGDTVSLGFSSTTSIVYTFKTTLTGAAFEVLIGGSAANALSNLSKAITATGVAGTDYGTGTVVHPSMTTGTLTTSTLVINSRSSGSSSNALPTTETSSSLSFATATLTGGVTGSQIIINGMQPGLYNGVYTVSSVIDTLNFTVDKVINNSGPSSLNFSPDPGAATVFGTTSASLIGHNGIGIGVNDNYNESLICTGNICIGNQNNNYLVEDDGHLATNNSSYILSNNISIGAGSVGFRNTGSLNAQFNNNFDYGSRIGTLVVAVIATRTITAAAWSASVATFTTSSAHNMVVGQKVLVEKIIPTGWNGYFSVASVPSSTSFTVAIAGDPGTALYFGDSKSLSRPVDGSSVNDNVFSNNVAYGINIGSQSDGVMVKDNTVKYCYNEGIDTSSGFGQIAANRIFNNGSTGILLSGPAGATEPLDALDVLDNQVYNNGTRVSGKNGISVSSQSSLPITNLNIQRNHSYDNQDTKTQAVGISVSGPLTNSNISNNNLAGNLTAGLSYLDTTTAITIRNNIGVNPDAKIKLGNITGTVTFDASVASFFNATLTGNITAVMPSSLVEGTVMTWVLQQDGTGSRTLTLPANAVPAGGSLTLSTTANKADVIVWVYRVSAAKWIELSRAKNDAPATSAPLRVVTLSSVSAVYTPNVDSTDLALIVTPGADFTVANPTGTPTDGQKVEIRIYSGATGRIPTWGSAFVAGPGTTLPTTALVNSSTTTYRFEYDASLAKYVLNGPPTTTVTIPEPRVNTLTSVSAVYTPNLDTTDLALIVNPGGNFTVANPTGTPVDGQKLEIRIYSTSTGRVPSWGSEYLAGPNTTLPVTALVNSSITTYFFEYDSSQAKLILSSPTNVATGASKAFATAMAVAL